MKKAPPLEWPLGTGRPARYVAATLWAVAALTVGWWLSTRLEWPAAVAVAFALAMTAAGFAWGWSVASPMTGSLRWDGQAWSWTPSGASQPRAIVRVGVMLDFGRTQVLYAQPGQWCVISASEDGALWHRLQVTLRQRLPRQDAVDVTS